MSRVATLNTYETALADLQRAQARQIKAQTQLSSEKKAEDLKGYGRESETLTAFRSMQARLQGFVDTGETVAARLDTQNFALERVGDAAARARKVISDAVAAGRGDTLMPELEGAFREAIEGMSAKHQGRYLFSGARVDTAPVAISKIADLTDPLMVPRFVNDTLKAASRLDEATSVETGMLANELGADLFAAFEAIQTYVDANQPVPPATRMPFEGNLTDAEHTFLTGALAAFDTAHDGLVEKTAANGSMQRRVEATLKSHADQTLALEDLVGKKVDVDLAEAITRLNQAQIAVQASAQVLTQLREISLLNYLT